MPPARKTRRTRNASQRRSTTRTQTDVARQTVAAGIAGYVGRKVVLDTEGPIMYLGTLREVRPEGYWLEDADIRDRNEGHVSKESYACEAKLNGIRANRRRIFVMAKVVISASALDDVIVEFPED